MLFWSRPSYNIGGNLVLVKSLQGLQELGLQNWCHLERHHQYDLFSAKPISFYCIFGSVSKLFSNLFAAVLS